MLTKTNPQTGDIIQIRTNDAIANPLTDIDFGHDHGFGESHVHDWYFPPDHASNKVREGRWVLKNNDLYLIEKAKNNGCH